MPMFTPQVKFDHLTVVVTDLERSIGFYVGFLGLTQVPRPNFDFEGAWLECGDVLLHLIKEHEASGPAANEISAELKPGRTWHFAFLVDNGDTYYQRALELGYKIYNPPKRRPDGAYQVFISDPDGYVVEICEQPPKTD